MTFWVGRCNRHHATCDLGCERAGDLYLSFDAWMDGWLTRNTPIAWVNEYTQAAAHLGICEAALKRICRRNNIRKWPYRQLASINRRLSEISTPSPLAKKQHNKARQDDKENEDDAVEDKDQEGEGDASEGESGARSPSTSEGDEEEAGFDRAFLLPHEKRRRPTRPSISPREYKTATATSTTTTTTSSIRAPEMKAGLSWNPADLEAKRQRLEMERQRIMVSTHLTHSKRSRANRPAGTVASSTQAPPPPEGGRSARRVEPRRPRRNSDGLLPSPQPPRGGNGGQESMLDFLAQVCTAEVTRPPRPLQVTLRTIPVLQKPTRRLPPLRARHDQLHVGKILLDLPQSNGSGSQLYHQQQQEHQDGCGGN